MSQYFKVDGRTLWNPSNGAARLFLRQVAVFEAELELPSGIGLMEADESRIDPVTFQMFVAALLARHRRTSHGVLIALSEGFVATVLVLAERAHLEIGWKSVDLAMGNGRTDVQVPSPSTPVGDEAWAAALQDRSRELGRFMAW
ncbi:DUF6086 family protein [Streptomyces sp. NPDC005813]|uniref:DUF6086 family protein n=1 Tax=Streptomyces sp. NPDC005813 TaxID=3155592 RepID=UPI0033EAC608